MASRFILIAIVGGLVAAQSPSVGAQSASAAAVAQVQNAHPRAIRRDVPLTNAIRRAIDAGTRNLTGRPGPNYWQLETDFTIEARLDPATHTITGTETIIIHNNSQMPSPVVLKVKFAAAGQAVQASPGSTVRTVDPQTAIVTWPVDVWFNGNRTFDAVIQTGGRAIESITLDPMCRFPDRDPNDNVWPAPKTPLAAGARAYACG